MKRRRRLNKWVCVQENQPATDAAGFKSENWVTLFDGWADVEPMVGREYLGSEQLESETTHKFHMRYREGIKPKMRIAWDERIFDIQSAINLREDDRFMAVMVVERD